MKKTGTIRVAAAVFVKTPGISPLKTRLARKIGREKAEEFFRLAVAAIRDVFGDFEKNAAHFFTPYWAVAEKEGESDDLWKDFSITPQGHGELGDRLDQVYSALIKKYDLVLLTGADSPQLSTVELKEAIKGLEQTDFVIGPAKDGGFYLFGGRAPIPKHIWLETPFSASHTTEVLATKLRGIGTVQLLDPLTDVDEVEDLLTLLQALEKRSAPSPAHRELIAFILNTLKHHG